MKYFCLMLSLGWTVTILSPAPAIAQNVGPNSALAANQSCIDSLRYRNGQVNNSAFATEVDAETAIALCQNVVDQPQSVAVYRCLYDGLYRWGYYHNPNYRSGLNVNEAAERCEDAANTRLALAQGRCLDGVVSLGASSGQGRRLCQGVRDALHADRITLCLQEQLYDVGFYGQARYRSNQSLEQATQTCLPDNT
jgi:hypothetical protein